MLLAWRDAAIHCPPDLAQSAAVEAAHPAALARHAAQAAAKACSHPLHALGMEPEPVCRLGRRSASCGEDSHQNQSDVAGQEQPAWAC